MSDREQRQSIRDGVRKKGGKSKLGYYMMIPEKNWYAPVQNRSSKMKAWKSNNDKLARLAKEVDVIFPSLYTMFDNQSDWIKYAKGNIAVHTGPAANEWKGHIKGATYSVQGNILAGPHVPQAMARAFENSTGELAERLLVVAQPEPPRRARRGQILPPLHHDDTVCRSGERAGSIEPRRCRQLVPSRRSSTSSTVTAPSNWPLASHTATASMS